MKGRRRNVTVPTVAMILAVVIALGLWRFNVPQTLGASDPTPLAEYAGILLAAISILFAIAFADSRYWPSLAELSWLCWIPQFLTLGGLAALSTWSVPTFSLTSLQFVPDFLWIATLLLGSLSVMKTIQLSSARPLNDTMSARLGTSLGELPFPRGKAALPSSGPGVSTKAVQDIENFRRAFREAVANGNVLSLRDLSDQFETAKRHSGPDSQTAFSTLGTGLAHEAAIAGLFRDLDGATTARTLRKLLRNPTNVVGSSPGPAGDHDEILHHIELSHPLLARVETQCRLLSESRTVAIVDVIDIRRAALELMSENIDWFDPSPKHLTRGRSESTPQAWRPATALRCFRWLTIRPTPGSASAIYALFQHATGRRYTGNYWTGSPILSETLDALEPHLRSRLLDVIAEQIITCTTTLHTFPHSHDSWHSHDDAVTTRSLLRTVHSLERIHGTNHALEELRERVAATDPLFFAPSAALPTPTTRELAVGHAVLVALRLAREHEGAALVNSLITYLAALPSDLSRRTERVLFRLTGTSTRDQLAATLEKERDYATDIRA